MKDNLENELECFMPNTQLSTELEVKELVIKKQESVTQGMCAFLCLERTLGLPDDSGRYRSPRPAAYPLLPHFSGLSPSCT